MGLLRTEQEPHSNELTIRLHEPEPLRSEEPMDWGNFPGLPIAQREYADQQDINQRNPFSSQLITEHPKNCRANRSR